MITLAYKHSCILYKKGAFCTKLIKHCSLSTNLLKHGKEVIVALSYLLHKSQKARTHKHYEAQANSNETHNVFLKLHTKVTDNNDMCLKVIWRPSTIVRGSKLYK